jgi:hypothetical protein
MPHPPLVLAVMALQKQTNEALLRSAEAGHSSARERAEYNEDCILRNQSQALDLLFTAQDLPTSLGKRSTIKAAQTKTT